MAPSIELLFDGGSYGGFALLLCEVLEELGVPTEQIKYVCHGEVGPEGLQGHIVIHL